MTRLLLRRALPAHVDFAAAHARRPDLFPCLFESVARGGDARFDVLAIAGTDSDIDAPGSVPPRGASPFLDALDRAWRASRIAHSAADVDLPFRGGWVLLLGYELAAEIEPRLALLPAPSGAPYATAIRTPLGAIRDRASGATTLIAEPEFAERLDAVERALLTPPGPAAAMLAPIACVEEPPLRFTDGVARIRAWLAAGDAFQVNLSRRWHANLETAPDPAALYRALTLANPAPYAASWRRGSRAVLSSSPERLVKIHGRRVVTSPIAGTRPRLPGDDDHARRGELSAHPKERAEHVMLLDLERNDLGRIAKPGSVVVESALKVESYAHVHHLVSDVSAELRDGASPVDVIRAVFPGGTITGAPKVRAMEIIAALEGEGRGAYTGAIGWLNRDGDMDLSILIRTIEINAAALSFRAGSGIVIDSNPERELDETRAKARGPLRALGNHKA